MSHMYQIMLSTKLDHHVNIHFDCNILLPCAVNKIIVHALLKCDHGHIDTFQAPYKRPYSFPQGFNQRGNFSPVQQVLQLQQRMHITEQGMQAPHALMQG